MTLPLAMVFPALWSLAHSRIGAALIAAAYFLGASRGLPEGVSIFFGGDRLLGIALWVGASLAFVGVHTALWSSRDGWQRPCRYLVANVLMSVPPLGIVGWANPTTAAGIMFPGWGWWGLASALVLLMATTAKGRWLVLVAIGGFTLVSAITWTDPVSPSGWIGLDTNFVSSRGQYADYAQQRATIELVREAARDGVKFVVLPEGAFGIWTPTVENFWARSLADLDLTVIGGAVILNSQGYQNLMMTVSPDGAKLLYRQRMPVPVSMWQPWLAGGASAEFFGNPVVELKGYRVAVLLCYEQLLIWPVLQSMLQNPDAIVATGNGWWTGSTSIMPIQKASATAWARLFNRPMALAFNVPKKGLPTKRD